ncbi:MAG: DUF4340 domain-containing protein [Lentimicrobiaceae bacterium]|nr:DUF4340 domain-containing protein [Lentimicrobiaceae bacterium]
MKKNKKIIIITLLLLLVATALILSDKTFTIQKALRDFAVDDTASITKIFLADKRDNMVTLTKVSPGEWKVNNKFTARKEGIDILLKTILNVSVREPIAKSAHNTVVKLLATRSVKVEIYQKVFRIHIGKLRLFEHEKRTKCYYVGDATMDNQGTFMIMDKSSQPFVCYLPHLRGFLTTRYTAKEDDWRDHSIFPLKPQEVTFLEIRFSETPKQSFRVTHRPGTDQFTFTDYNNKQLLDFDIPKVVDLFTTISTLKFEALLNNVVPVEIRDSILLCTPLHTITLHDKFNKEYVLQTFHKPPRFDDETNSAGVPLQFDPDRMYAYSVWSNDLLLIQFYAFESFLKPAAFYQLSGK